MVYTFLGLDATGTQTGWPSKLCASQTDQFDDIFGPVEPTETASNSAASVTFSLFKGLLGYECKPKCD